MQSYTVGHALTDLLQGATFEHVLGKLEEGEKSASIDVVVYHGATQPFDVGDIRLPAFFSSDSKVALRFAESRAKHAGEDNPKPRVIAVRLRFKHPKIIEANGDFAGNLQFGLKSGDYRSALKNTTYDGIIFRNTQDEGDVYVVTRRKAILGLA